MIFIIVGLFFFLLFGFIIILFLLVFIIELVYKKLLKDVFLVGVVIVVGFLSSIVVKVIF